MPKIGQKLAPEPFWSTTDGKTVRLYQGDVREVLRGLPEKSVHCVVTSPPYWGLRSYLADGHVDKEYELGAEPSPDCDTHGQAQCGGCFVCAMVAVFREVRRVLRDDGTLYLNLGDSYSSGGRVGHGTRQGHKQQTNRGMNGQVDPERVDAGLPSGNLVGIPWRVALALQADGWILRQDIVWAKPAPMPESVRNRCTKAHEYVFLLAKRAGYYFDCEAIKEPAEPVPSIASKDDLIWLGAMIDAEGSIGINRKIKGKRQINPTYCARLCCYNTCRSILDRCVSITGVGQSKERRDSKGRMVYQWQVAGPKTLAIIKATEPYLMAKKVQAALAVELQESNYISKSGGSGSKSNEVLRRQVEIYLGCSELNKTGTSEIVHKEIVRESPNKQSNKRSVWRVSSGGYAGAHFATYPVKLIEPMLKAGTSAKGCCAGCGAPWRRVTTEERLTRERPNDFVKYAEERGVKSGLNKDRGDGGRSTDVGTPRKAGVNSCSNSVAGVEVRTVGWEPTCECHGKVVRRRLEKSRVDPIGLPDQPGNPRAAGSKLTGGAYAPPGQAAHSNARESLSEDVERTVTVYESDLPLDEHPVVPCTALDIFVGSGTTCCVALSLGLRSIGIDLSAKYLSVNAVPRIEGELRSRPATVRLVPLREGPPAYRHRKKAEG